MRSLKSVSRSALVAVLLVSASASAQEDEHRGISGRLVSVGLVAGESSTEGRFLVNETANGYPS